MAIAEKTDVPFEKSLAEVVTHLRKAGADRIAQMDGSVEFAIQFELADRLIRFRVPFLTDAEVTQRTGPRQDRKVVAEQWRRQRGRALLLVVKAKLESVEIGIESVEQAFLANVVTRTGRTVFEAITAGETIALADPAQGVATLLGGPR